MSDETPRKRRKKWPLVLLGLFIILLALVFFLPSLLSSSFARDKILAKVNEKVDGTVAIDDWKLSWFGENTVNGIRFTDAHGVKVADVEAVVIQKGLIELAKDQENLGEIIVRKPHVAVVLPEPKLDKPSSGTPTTGEGPETPKNPEAKSGSEPAAPPRIPVNAVVTIEQGTVELTPPGGRDPLLISNLNVGLDVKKDQPQVHLIADGQVGAAKSPLNIDVAVKPITGDTFEPENLAAEGQVKTEALELGPLLAVGAALNAQVPTGAGALHADVTFKTSGTQNADASGEIRATGLILQGGGLGTDQPNLGDVEFVFHANQSAGGFSFKDTAIHSRFINATVGGDLPKLGEGTIDFNGVVDLAALAKELPGTLKLQKGLSLSSGSLEAAAQLKNKGETQTVGTTLIVSNVAGHIDGKAVRLEQPVELQLAAAKTGEALDVQLLKITSSFLQAQGRGTLDDFSVTANASLEKALAEVSQFVDLGEWEAKGSAELKVSVLKVNEKERNLKFGFESPAFQLRQGAKELLPEQPVSVQAEARADIPEKGFLTQVYKLESSFNTAIASGKLNLVNLVLPEKVEGEKAPLPTVETVSLNASIDLAALSNVLPPPTNGPPITLAGRATVAGAGSLTDQGIDTRVISLGLADFHFEQGVKSLFQRQASVTTRMHLKPEEKFVVLRDVLGKFSVGEIRADRIELKNWTDVINTLDATIGGQFDLMQVSKELAKWSAAEEALPMGGTAEINLSAKPDGDQGGRFGVDTQLHNFAWKLKNQQVITDSNVAFRVNAQFANDMDMLNLSGLELSSTPLTLKSDVGISGLKSSMMLNAKGSIMYDMAKIDPYIKMLSGQELNARGAVSKPFTLRLPLGPEVEGKPKVLPYFDSSFYAESMNLYGLNIRDLEIPLLLENNLLQTSLDAKVNNGTLAFYPSIDLGQEMPLLTIPTNSVVLDNVDLTDELANDLLGKIHPIFKGAAVTDGKVSMRLDYLEVPTAGDIKQGLRFAGTFTLADVKLSGSPLVGLAMKLGKVNESDFGFEQEELRFVCEDGWITPSPLKIDVEEFPLTFAGRLGLDSTLDYSVSVPVTKKILDERYARYLEGESITVPIGGTVSKPRISSDAWQKALKPLVAKGAQRAAGELLNEKAGKLLEGLLK